MVVIARRNERRERNGVTGMGRMKAEGVCVCVKGRFECVRYKGLMRKSFISN